ncbi:hypothetical protein [Sphingomonas sp. 3-13AW]|uniref:hypothetical protein n=1 Tax=Sphingomonas sp. 3-13AW TaxID=3050450 RepID=UPI003BB59EA6
MKIRLETSQDGLVVGLFATLNAVEQKDDFRVETLKKRLAFEADVVNLIENQISHQWGFVQDLRAALCPPGTNSTALDPQIDRTWSKIKASAGRAPWLGDFEPLVRRAREMGIEQALDLAA